MPIQLRKPTKKRNETLINVSLNVLKKKQKKNTYPMSIQSKRVKDS